MRYLLVFSLAAMLAAPLAAQTVHGDDHEWCRSDTYSHDDRATYCEVRTFTLAPRDVVRADAAPNGGIHVRGWDQEQVEVQARVRARGRSEEEARRYVKSTTIETDGTLRSMTPRVARRDWVSVSFRLKVPRRSNLDLEAHNGGIDIEDVTGEIRFDTQNGGVDLSGVGGDVRGQTMNGGLKIDLTGDRWDGDRLDVKTTNGGVKMRIPDGYSADLEAGTVNGGMKIDFPVLLEGDISRRVRTTLGDGGALVRVVTTNGGVKIERG